MHAIAGNARLFDKINPVERLRVGQKEVEGFLHVNSQSFWKAGCHDSVSRSSAREALSASFPSSA